MNREKMKPVFGISAQGRNELIAHRQGRRITRNQAIKAKCYECTGGYADGKGDCGIADCPLYNFMAYREGVDKIAFNPVAPQKTTPASKTEVVMGGTMR